MRIAFSQSPRRIGGGSNTFIHNFTRWARANGHRVVPWPLAERLIVVAHLADARQLRWARRLGCRIVHRVDEYFEQHETEGRRRKHEHIRRLNALAHMTVFQSDFVRQNALPYLGSKHYVVIRNGADPARFRPAAEPGSCIGHVTWSVGERKRLDLLRETILAHPGERFLLVGRHADSDLDFALPNVTRQGPVTNAEMPALYHQMKTLYFPSETDPCPNTVIEAILSGVPVCYNPSGGTPELIQGCGEPLDRFEALLANLPAYRARCLHRPDLHFEAVAPRYLEV